MGINNERKKRRNITLWNYLGLKIITEDRKNQDVKRKSEDSVISLARTSHQRLSKHSVTSLARHFHHKQIYPSYSEPDNLQRDFQFREEDFPVLGHHNCNIFRTNLTSDLRQVYILPVPQKPGLPPDIRKSIESHSLFGGYRVMFFSGLNCVKSFTYPCLTNSNLISSMDGHGHGYFRTYPDSYNCLTNSNPISSMDGHGHGYFRTYPDSWRNPEKIKAFIPQSHQHIPCNIQDFILTRDQSITLSSTDLISRTSPVVQVGCSKTPARQLFLLQKMNESLSKAIGKVESSYINSIRQQPRTRCRVILQGSSMRRFKWEIFWSSCYYHQQNRFNDRIVSTRRRELFWQAIRKLRNNDSNDDISQDILSEQSEWETSENSQNGCSHSCTSSLSIDEKDYDSQTESYTSQPSHYEIMNTSWEDFHNTAFPIHAVTMDYGATIHSAIDSLPTSDTVYNDGMLMYDKGLVESVGVSKIQAPRGMTILQKFFSGSSTTGVINNSTTCTIGTLTSHATDRIQERKPETYSVKLQGRNSTMDTLRAMDLLFNMRNRTVTGTLICTQPAAEIHESSVISEGTQSVCDSDSLSADLDYYENASSFRDETAPCPYKRKRISPPFFQDIFISSEDIICYKELYERGHSHSSDYSDKELEIMEHNLYICDTIPDIGLMFQLGANYSGKSRIMKRRSKSVSKYSGLTEHPNTQTTDTEPIGTRAIIKTLTCGLEEDSEVNVDRHSINRKSSSKYNYYYEMFNFVVVVIPALLALTPLLCLFTPHYVGLLSLLRFDKRLANDR